MQVRTAVTRADVTNFLLLSPDAVVLVNADGRIAEVNDELERLLGYDRDELRGQAVEVLVPADRRGRHVDDRVNYQQTPTRRPMGAGAHLTALHADGHEIPVDIALQPILVEQEHMTAAVLRDVSAARDAADTIRTIARQLHDANEELRAANRRLEDASDQQQQFLNVAAHELRTPLQALTGYADLLITRWDVLPDEDKKKHLEVIHRNAAKQAVLVNDLLEAARISADRIEVETSDAQLLPVIAEALDLVPDAVEVVQVDCPADLEVRADPIRLGQVLINLASNAMKYGEPPMVIRAARVDDAIRIDVSDAGSGVPDELAPFLFEAFARARHKLDKKKTSSGLGLYISRWLVGAMNGRIEYLREDGLTTFRVTLPAVD